MTKAKKLPDVWVIWIDSKSCDAFAKKRQAGTWKSYRYTPAKPAKEKVCVWTVRPYDRQAPPRPIFDTACGDVAVLSGDWCTYCGGKIKVKR